MYHQGLEWPEEVYQRAIDLFSEYIRNIHHEEKFSDWHVMQLDRDSGVDCEVHELIQKRIFEYDEGGYIE